MITNQYFTEINHLIPSFRFFQTSLTVKKLLISRVYLQARYKNRHRPQQGPDPNRVYEQPEHLRKAKRLSSFLRRLLVQNFQPRLARVSTQSPIQSLLSQRLLRVSQRPHARLLAHRRSASTHRGG